MRGLIGQIPSSLIFFTMVGIAIVSILTGLWLDQKLILLIPAAAILILAALTDIKYIFFLFVLTLPASIEVQLTNGLGTDLPTEPLMIGLMLLFLLYTGVHLHKMDKGFWGHPLTQLIILHLLWIGICTLFSQVHIVSIKFLLAKTWYIVAMTFVAGLILKDYKSFKIPFWLIFTSLTALTVFVLYKHYLIGFSFSEVNKTMSPFFRNHVTYATILVVFLPYVIAVRSRQKLGSIPATILSIGIVVLVAGTIFSYTRTAQGCLLIMVLTYLLVRFNLIKIATVSAVVIAFLGVIWMSQNNNYLEYAPNYKKTIYHKNWDKHLAATLKGQDVSTMERFYRWIAGFRMISERPITGYGPGNFFNFYKSHTVRSFETYVSDNPEKSTAHNYFITVAAEQGLPGLAIFLAMLIVFLWRGQSLYLKIKDPDDKALLMALIVSMVVILANNFMSDLIETDKNGAFFFMALALLINLDIKYSKAKSGMEEALTAHSQLENKQSLKQKKD